LKIVAKNKKAFFDYEIQERFEAGISLIGSEVKSLRLGKCNLKDSFVRIIKGEAFMFNSHISYLETVNVHFKPEERRPRKLLMHRKEIDKLIGKIKLDGLTLIPTMLYFNKKNLAKVEIAVAKGKNVADKRDTIRERDLNREARAAMKRDY
jgi:SsrA-binding protein